MADPCPNPTAPDGAPHPRETARLFGQAPAETEFLRPSPGPPAPRLASDRAEGRGQGNAGLAHRPLPAGHARQTAACSPPRPPPKRWTFRRRHDPVPAACARWPNRGFHLLRRGPNDKGTAMSQFISVDEVRKLKSFFALSAADGGAGSPSSMQLDEMNTAAANALLKLLEEPPPAATFLIAHQPAPVAHDPLALPGAASGAAGSRPTWPHALTQAGGDIAPEERGALAELAAGSVGEAFRLTNS
jgi:DNA polymerase-3 subunit delta'